MKKIVFYFTLVISIQLNAQMQNFEYLKTYSASGYQSAHNVSQTSDSGFVATGWYNNNISLYKVSKCGDFEWLTSFNNGTEGAYRVIQTSDGGYFLSGTIWAGSAYEYDYLALKVNATGTAQQFAKVWRGPYSASGSDIAYWAEEHSSGYVTSGISTNWPYWRTNAIVTNYNLNGAIQWVRVVGAGGDESFGSVHPVSGGFIASGATNSFGSGGYDLMAVKLGTNGTPTWMYTYGTNGNEGGTYTSKGIPDSNGDYVIVGYTDNTSLSQGGTDVLVVKINTNGNVIWAYTYGSPNNEEAYNVELTRNGYIISGYTNNNSNGGNDGLIMEIDNSGSLLWAKAVGDAGNDYGYSVVPVNRGVDGYMMSMNRETSLGSGNYDPMYARTDSLGSASCNSNTLSLVATNVTNSINRTTIPTSGTTAVSPAQYTTSFSATSVNPTENFICLACTSSPPSFTMSSDTICENEQVTIVNTTVTPPACAQWTASGNLFSTAIDTVVASFSAGVYNIELTSICGNSVLTTTQTLTVHPAPTSDFLLPGNPVPEIVCENDTPFTFVNTGTSGSNITYNWDLGNGANPPTSTLENPTPIYYNFPGTKYVKQLLINQFNCRDSSLQIFHVEPLPTVNFSTDTPICIADSAYFTNLTWVGGTSTNATWLWYFGDGDSSTTFQPWHAYTSPGTYNVQLVATSGVGCRDSLTLPISVAPLTVPGFVASNDTVCAYNNSGILTLTGNTGTPQYWEYSTDGGFNWYPISNTTLTQNYLNLSTTTIFRAFVKSGLCPGAYADSAIISVDMPSVGGRTLKDTTVCLENNNGLLTASGYLGQITNWEFSDDSGQTWTAVNTTNDTMLFNNLVQNRLYRFIVVNGVCPADTSTEAMVYVYKFNGAYAEKDTTISLGNSVSIFADGGINYAWFPNYNINDTSMQDVIVNPLETTQYNVIVYDENGCMDTAQVLITVLRDYNVQISNTITPNNDGFNDTWYIGNIQNYPNNEVTIFNRFGKVLYTKTGYNNEWDGTFNGKVLPDGTYFYILKFTDSNISFKGDINIINSINK